MQTKRIRTLHKIITALIIVTMISLTFAGAMGALYVRAAWRRPGAAGAVR